MSTPALQPDAHSAQPEPRPQLRRDQTWRQKPEHRPAVNAYERDRYRRQQAGTWAPFTLTGPVRDQVDQLHEAGMTSEQIARVSGVGVGVSTLTRLFKVTRMTTTAAEAILAGSPLVQTAATPDLVRQLQALVADGWTAAGGSRAPSTSEARRRICGLDD
jgi:hypothetical protein